jgi:hypothetical protein
MARTVDTCTKRRQATVVIPRSAARFRRTLFISRDEESLLVLLTTNPRLYK